jgi:hypothetical protein
LRSSCEPRASGRRRGRRPPRSERRVSRGRSPRPVSGDPSGEDAASARRRSFCAPWRRAGVPCASTAAPAARAPGRR